MSLNVLRDEALRIAREHGFTEATPGEDMALIHSEVSEALEDIRKGEPLALVWYEDKKGDRYRDAFNGFEGTPGAVMLKPCGVPSEIADVIIRALHFCGKHGIDLDRAVAEKMRFNDSRPFKHGKTL